MNFPESSYCLCSEVCIAAHLSACVNYVFIIDNVYDTYATQVLIWSAVTAVCFQSDSMKSAPMWVQSNDN